VLGQPRRDRPGGQAPPGGLDGERVGDGALRELVVVTEGLAVGGHQDEAVAGGVLRPVDELGR
jgi:hypothetical protein